MVIFNNPITWLSIIILVTLILTAIFSYAIFWTALTAIGTLILGAIALFQEHFRQWWFKPELNIGFKLNPPCCCHTTKENKIKNNVIVKSFPTYFFRFVVSNTGRSQARLVEAVIEELWYKDSNGIFLKQKDFIPVNLKWSVTDNQFINLSPHRSYYCNIGGIPHADVNLLQTPRKLFGWQGEHDSEVLKFFFDLVNAPFSQPDYIVPGSYKFKIVIFSENAKKVSSIFELKWSGHWRDNEEDMLREIVIEIK